METAASPPRVRLFLVDDDDDSRELFAEYLRLEGFEVAEYARAEDALAAMAGEVPAAVVTDVTLAGMSGCEAATMIRGDVRTRDVPLVAVTGRHLSDLGDGGELFDSVLVKPVDTTKLVATVRRLLAARNAGRA